MSQGHLFQPPIAAAIDKALSSPISAKRDPESSHQAAKEITESGKREGQLMGVLALIKKYPLSTSLELAKKGCEYDRYVIARRLPELETARLVTRRGLRKCGVSGKLATQWEAF